MTTCLLVLSLTWVLNVSVDAPLVAEVEKDPKPSKMARVGRIVKNIVLLPVTIPRDTWRDFKRAIWVDQQYGN